MMSLAHDVPSWLPSMLINAVRSLRQKHTLLSRLHVAYDDDLQGLDAFWHSVWNGPGDYISDLARCHRLAYTSLPDWRHRKYMPQFEAQRLVLPQEVVTRIDDREDQLHRLDGYRAELRQLFETEPGKTVWQAQEAWKDAYEGDNLEQRLRANQERMAVTIQISDFCDHDPCLKLRNDINEQVNRLRQAGNPITAWQPPRRFHGQQMPSNVGL